MKWPIHSGLANETKTYSKTLFSIMVAFFVIQNFGCAPSLQHYKVDSEPQGGMAVMKGYRQIQPKGYRQIHPTDTLAIYPLGLTPTVWSLPRSVDSIKVEVYKSGYEKAASIVYRDTTSDTTRIFLALHPIADSLIVTNRSYPKNILICAPDFWVKIIQVGGKREISPAATEEALRPMLNVVVDYLNNREYNTTIGDTTCLLDLIEKFQAGCNNLNPYISPWIPANYGIPPKLSDPAMLSDLKVLRDSLHVDGIVFLSGKATAESGSRKFLKVGGGIAFSAVTAGVIGAIAGPVYTSGITAYYAVPTIDFPNVEGANLELTYLDAHTGEYLWFNRLSLNGNVLKEKIAKLGAYGLVFGFPAHESIQEGENFEPDRVAEVTRKVSISKDGLDAKIFGIPKKEIIESLQKFAMLKKIEFRVLSDNQYIYNQGPLLSKDYLLDVIQIDGCVRIVAIVNYLEIVNVNYSNIIYGFERDPVLNIKLKILLREFVDYLMGTPAVTYSH